MQKLDYIVVGLGLSGIAFCEQLEAAGKNFEVYDKGPSASKVSGGVYNPVILKRYTLPWRAEELLDYAVPYYQDLEKKLQTKINYDLDVLRIFSSIEDQNNWFNALGTEGLSRFMDKTLVKSNPQVNSRFKMGKVRETGRIDVPHLICAYADYLKGKNAYLNESFDYSKIDFNEDQTTYNGVPVERIIFAEGYGIKNNPYFNRLPLVGNKGEYLFIKAPDLQLTDAIKAQFFIIPLGDSVYKVGATFNWKEKDDVPTSSALITIKEKLEEVINCDYKIINQEAGIRPTTGDRRALLGKHPKHSSLVLLNGMGTRGIMMAPYLSKMLYDHLEENIELDPGVDIMRFPKKF